MRAHITRHAGLIIATFIGLVILLPGLIERGYFLRYDMVFVPHLALSASTAGLDGDVPRAVPNDLIVALMSTVAPGWLVQRIILLGAFCAIGMGVDRLRGLGTYGTVTVRVIASIALTWNPWIAERLSIGHWGYLWGYTACVWAFVGVWRWRTDGSRFARRIVLIALVMAALSGSSGDVLVAIVLLIGLGMPGEHSLTLRQMASGSGLWLALGAAWWWPFLTLANSQAADGQGVTAFAAHSDGWGPTGLSLLSGGGIWHSPSWFAERSQPFVAILSALLLLAGVVSLAFITHGVIRRYALVLAAAGLCIAGLGSISSSALIWVVQHLPGGGLLRDGQKFVCLWVIPAAFGLGLLAQRARRQCTGTFLAPMSVIAMGVAPVVLLPGLAFERGGAWNTASYPQEFREVAHQLNTADGAVAVFPWQLYRTYTWNNNAVVLDPWQRLLTGRVIVDDDLPLRSGIVHGESKAAHDISSALRTHSSSGLEAVLHKNGVRYVLNQKGQPAGMGKAPDVGIVIHNGPELTVRDVGPAPSPATKRWAPLGLAMSASAVVVLFWRSVRAAWWRRSAQRVTHHQDVE